MTTLDLAGRPAGAPLPIVVDLDDTLLLTDTLHEAFARAVFHQPDAALAAVRTLPRGRYAVKAALAARVPLDSVPSATRCQTGSTSAAALNCKVA